MSNNMSTEEMQAVAKALNEYVLVCCEKAKSETSRSLDMSESEAKVLAEFVKQNGETNKALIESKTAMKDRICRYVCVGLESAVKVLMIVTGAGMFYSGLEFEKEGSYTTSTMRNFAGKATDIFKK